MKRNEFNKILFAMILQDKDLISNELSTVDTELKFDGIVYYLDSQFLKDIKWVAEILVQNYEIIWQMGAK